MLIASVDIFIAMFTCRVTMLVIQISILAVFYYGLQLMIVLFSLQLMKDQN